MFLRRRHLNLRSLHYLQWIELLLDQGLRYLPSTNILTIWCPGRVDGIRKISSKSKVTLEFLWESNPRMGEGQMRKPRKLIIDSSLSGKEVEHDW